MPTEIWQLGMERRPASARMASHEWEPARAVMRWEPPPPSWPLPSPPPTKRHPPAPHRPPPIKWAHGRDRSHAHDVRWQGSVRGLAETARLTAQFVDRHHQDPLIKNSNLALTEALSNSLRSRKEALTAMFDSEGKLTQIFKVHEQMLQAKAVFLPASKAIVRLTRASSVLEDAAARMHDAHIHANDVMHREWQAQLQVLASETKDLENVLCNVDTSLAKEKAKCSGLRTMLREETADRNALLIARQLLKTEVTTLDTMVADIGPNCTALRLEVAALRGGLAEACHENRMQDGMISLLSRELRDVERNAQETEQGMRDKMTTLLADFAKSSSKLTAELAQNARLLRELNGNIERLKHELTDARAVGMAQEEQLRHTVLELEQLAGEHHTAEAEWRHKEAVLQLQLEDAKRDAAEMDAKWRAWEAKLEDRLAYQRLSSAIRRAFLHRALNMQRMSAAFSETKLRRQWEEHIEIATRREHELDSQRNEVVELARTEISALTRQIEQQRLHQGVELHEIGLERDEEARAREAFEGKLIAMAAKLRDARAQAGAMEVRKTEAGRREMQLSRELKEAKATQQELASKLVDERKQRSLLESESGREIAKLKKAWRVASAKLVAAPLA